MKRRKHQAADTDYITAGELTAGDGVDLFDPETQTHTQVVVRTVGGDDAHTVTLEVFDDPTASEPTIVVLGRLHRLRYHGKTELLSPKAVEKRQRRHAKQVQAA